ncbi:hypothetical protein FVR03_10785 [Pontibacter qinzhouensis]|uniref:Uncharacterized protein n=1 Tax=Pontibacter qinzhouensis TaxID=2603253 RepID=A0A5C8K8M1_9BACT|nr:hypothetical protein [Pontibacter qinzhouensis]TXK46365.1 hypothetical protein FVR03_10785 [Pontibacter qinzhouensis]
MKKILLLSIFALSTASASFAQSSYVSLTPDAEKKCLEMTRALTNSLQLNEPEYIKLKALNRSLFAKTAEINAAYNNDQAARLQKLNELELNFEKDLTSFLTPMQLTSFSHYKKEGNTSLMAITESR